MTYLNKLFLAIVLSILSPLAAAQSNEDCARYAAYREASGEPVHGIRAVLDVIYTRAKIDNMSVCKVVTRSGQFSWFNSSVDWKVPKQWLTKYREAANMEAQVPPTVYFFNNAPFKKIGVFCCKIGNHWFYHRKKE